MVDVRTWWAAAGGQAPPRELVEARAGLTRAQRRAARRSVRRGRAAENTATARLAVALARVTLRRRAPEWIETFFAFMVVGWLAFTIWGIATGSVLVAVVFAAATVFGVWTLNLMRPRYRRAAQAAERVNRELLERAGEPYRDDAARAEPLEPAPLAVAAGAVGSWVYYDLFFGFLIDAVDRKPLVLRHAVVGGALFATFMTIYHLTIARRRAKRQAHRPIS
jgi:hypothetical protein